MPEYVRVADLDTGHKLTVFRSEVANGHYRVLDENAVDANGDPLGGELNAVDPEPPVEDPQVSGYDSLKRSELEDEIAKRNAVREPGDHIQIAAPGNKPELVAALKADDDQHPEEN